MPYTPEVHGPLRRMDLSNGLDFVYWDTRLGKAKQFYGFMVMPTNLEPPTEYDSRKNGVKISWVGPGDSLEEMSSGLKPGSSMNVGYAGRSYLIQIPSGDPSSPEPYVSHQIMLQPEPGVYEELVGLLTLDWASVNPSATI
ncbi:hypothetical protein L218DRAFT_947248 [Marasmius fiardii PR-910]|nr:hypothetical protein L218DRAFT_947248 [Marasmius fiardii PR-910]